MAGKIIADQIEHSTAGSVSTQYVVEGSAKSVVYFNGIGTLTVHHTFNVTSVSDDGQGLYSVTITNNHDDAYYSKIGTGGRDSTANQDRWLGLYDATTGTYKVQAQYEASSTYVDSQISGITHGDLA